MIDIPMQVQLWREHCANGTVTREEMRDAIEYLRAGREHSAEVAVIKKSKAKAPTNAQALLDDFKSQMEEVKK